VRQFPFGVKVSEVTDVTCCDTVATLLAHCCWIVVTLLLHCCLSKCLRLRALHVVTPVLHSFYTVVAFLLHCCHTVVALSKCLRLRALQQQASSGLTHRTGKGTITPPRVMVIELESNGYRVRE
jgi:hypothetical protein